MGKPIAIALLLAAGILGFQNCGPGFSSRDIASGAPSVFPTDYTPYGTIPSQGVNALPRANKVNAQSSAAAGAGGGTNVLTCMNPPCYR